MSISANTYKQSEHFLGQFNEAMNYEDYLNAEARLGKMTENKDFNQPLFFILLICFFLVTVKIIIRKRPGIWS
jgi:hypothetical protein